MNTIELIQEAFDNHHIKYRIVETEQISFIDAGYNIQGGPTVRFHFISQNRNDSNDVQIRIFGLLNKIGAEKRTAFPEVLCRQGRKPVRPGGSADQNIRGLCRGVLLRTVHQEHADP